MKQKFYNTLPNIWKAKPVPTSSKRKYHLHIHLNIIENINEEFRSKKESLEHKQIHYLYAGEIKIVKTVIAESTSSNLVSVVANHSYIPSS